MRQINTFSPHLSCGFCHIPLDKLCLSRMFPLGLVSMEIYLWGRKVYLLKENHKGLLASGIKKSPREAKRGESCTNSSEKLMYFTLVQSCVYGAEISWKSNLRQKQINNITLSDGIKHTNFLYPYYRAFILQGVTGKTVEGDSKVFQWRKVSNGLLQGKTDWDYCLEQSEAVMRSLATSTRCHSDSI